MKKTRLLELIQRGIISEERAISALSEHVGASHEWVAFTEEESKNICQTLTKIYDDSQRHQRMLEKLIEEIKKDSKEEY